MKSRHPSFKGNWDDLYEFELLASSPIRTEKREEALKRWEQYKLKRQGSGGGKKGAHMRALISRVIDLRGANLDGICVGFADLRGVMLDGASLRSAWLKGTDLENASLRNTDFRAASHEGRGAGRLLHANLSGADFTDAKLNGVDLSFANLNDAKLIKADLTDADLSHTTLIRTEVENSLLKNTRVYGISAWDIKGKPLMQQDLIVTQARTLGDKSYYYVLKESQGEIHRTSVEEDANQMNFLTVDDLEMAQFVYLLLNNKNIRTIIDTITSKAVLILGRFTRERKPVLDAIREELRKYNFTPILFDFETPERKDATGTVETLARMARFIIADLTDPSAIPHELATIVPHLRTTPVQPIRLKGAIGYSMFDDFKVYPWVMKEYGYKDSSSLIKDLPKMISPINKKADSLRS
jgi:hypothetical protein